MATRLLCHALTRQLRVTQLQATRTWTRNNLLCATHKPLVWNGNRRVLLHLRVTDTDAGLEAKRLANRQQDESFNVESEELNTRRLRPSRRRTESKFVAPAITENLVEQDDATETITRKKDELILGDDADIFGNARSSEEVDEGDVEEEAYISKPTRRTKKIDTREYAKMIKEHLNAKRLNEAIDVLEVRMLKEDRVKPENYIYNLLISGCAKAGYTRKAFSLFTKMRQRGLKVTGGTYTSLFNACANAPTLADGLAKAQHLREVMLEKGYEPNVKNYNAMIKAYGRCGDVKTAYLLADEMRERHIEFNGETYNFLLQACASDKKFGFRHALLTYHKMIKSGISPDYYTFHTVLRCVRDCGFGDLETMQEVLAQIAPNADITQPPQLTDGQPEPIQIESNSEKSNPNLLQTNPFKDQLETPIIANGQIAISNNEVPISGSTEPNPFKEQLQVKTAPVSTDLQIPNLLLPQPHLGSLVALSEVTKPHERFLLLGGITGYLDLMKSHNVTPDIETFTTMLEVIPPTNAAEKQLITFIRKIGLKADIDFFNILIKKRSMRFDYESAKEVLSMIRTAKLQPDIVTYGVLALGCQTQGEAHELLQQMQAAGVKMNVQILGAMLRQGCAQTSFDYVNEIMQISLDYGIKPNEQFLRHLHNFYKQCARAIDARHPSTKGKTYKKGHAKFCDKYRLYYEEQGLTGMKLEDAIQKIKERPYANFKKASQDGMEPLKNETLARKQKLRKYIKKIKVENLRNDAVPVRPNPKQLE